MRILNVKEFKAKLAMVKQAFTKNKESLQGFHEQRIEEDIITV